MSQPTKAEAMLNGRKQHQELVYRLFHSTGFRLEQISEENLPRINLGSSLGFA